MSRPKRACKAAALVALRCEDDGSSVYEDSEEEEIGVVTECMSGDDSLLHAEDIFEDDLLDHDQLTAMSPEDSSSEEEESQENSTAVSHPEQHQHTSITPSGIQWTDQHPNALGRLSAQNIINFRSGVKPGVNPCTEMEAFPMFINDLIPDLVRYSNLQGRRITQGWNLTCHPSKRRQWRNIDNIEMVAFIGIVILLGK